MRRQITIKNIICLMAVCIAVAGCATSTPTDKLAEITAANASLVQTKITNFNKSTEEIYSGRAEAAAKLSQAVEYSRMEADSYLEASSAAATIAGVSKEPHYGTVVSELQRVATVIQARQAVAFNRRAEISAAAISEYTPLQKPPEELKFIATNLSSMAEQPTNAEQLKLFLVFVEEILGGLEETDDQNNADEDAKGQADEMIETLVE